MIAKYPSIQFKYVKFQIDICDLDKIKKLFKFLLNMQRCNRKRCCP